jgi:protein-S-isoprenylcysteine O-methyltransferase Ste14
MNGKALWRNRLEQAAGMVTALLAVTGVSYLWRLPQAWGPRVVLAVYWFSFFLLLGAALVIFRRVVRRAYQLQGRLTPPSFFLQILLWGIYFAFPCIYDPYDWAWSSPNGAAGTPLLAIVGWTCVGLGLGSLALAMAWLGWFRSSGQGSKNLEQSGPYRVIRNPQLMAGMLLIAGYIALRPSWYALGWFVLYAAMAHSMVLAEERWLKTIHGETFEKYCRRVPRYVGLPRRS